MTNRMTSKNMSWEKATGKCIEAWKIDKNQKKSYCRFAKHEMCGILITCRAFSGVKASARRRSEGFMYFHS